MGIYGGPENTKLLETLIERQYGNTPQGVAETKNLAKIDAPILSTTTGYYNATFGASVFQQLNTSSVLFNLLPKFQYERSGYRAQTTRFKNSGIGVTENGAVPDSVKPTIAPVTVGIKEHSIAVEISQRDLMLMENSKDDVAWDMQAILASAGESFTYALDADMNVQVGTLASNNIESIDRVVSSYDEITSCSETAGDGDIYGLDRDAAASWADAYVNHNSANLHSISKKIIRDLVSNTIKAGANPKTQAWYTGDDTWAEIMALFENQERLEATGGFNLGDSIEGSGQQGGINFGTEMQKLHGRPVYVAPSDKVAKTTSGISNLYLLDVGYDKLYNAPKLGVKVLKAPILATTRLETYPAHAKLGNETVLYAAMELEAKRFNIQGKARDLTTV